MEIRIPTFEKKEVDIRESYVDENGHHQERIKKVLVPTGKLLDADNSKTKTEIDDPNKNN